MDTSDLQYNTNSYTASFKFVYSTNINYFTIYPNETISNMVNRLTPIIKSYFKILHESNIQIIHCNQGETGQSINNLYPSDWSVARAFCPNDHSHNNNLVFYIRFGNDCLTEFSGNYESRQAARLVRDMVIYDRITVSISNRPIIGIDNNSGSDTEEIPDWGGYDTQPMDIDSRPPSPPSPSLIRTVPRTNRISRVNNTVRDTIAWLDTPTIHTGNREMYGRLTRFSPREPIIDIPPRTIIGGSNRDRINHIIQRENAVIIQRNWRNRDNRIYHTCPVCYDSFANMNTYYRCEHLLCRQCFNDWDARNTTCPSCRAPVISVIPEAVIENNTVTVAIDPPSNTVSSTNDNPNGLNNYIMNVINNVAASIQAEQPNLNNHRTDNIINNFRNNISNYINNRANTDLEDMNDYLRQHVLSRQEEENNNYDRDESIDDSMVNMQNMPVSQAATILTDMMIDSD